MLDEQGIMRAVKSRWWDKLKAKLPPLDSQSAQTMSVVRSVPDEYHDGFKVLTYFRWFVTDVWASVTNKSVFICGLFIR